MPKVTRADLEVREAREEDQPAVVALLRESLKHQEDEHYEEFLQWKHRANPFGASPAWVAVHDGAVVGYRTFMRWGFVDDEGRKLRALRAVDTATSPAYQGLGIFRTLTLRGVAELTLAGDGFIFNTPNDQSRPGYLKMGWTVSRRLPVGVLPAGPAAVRRMARSRVPANTWSEPTTAGLPAGEALADPGVAAALLQHAPTHGVRTARTPEYLAWRTAFGPLHYRLLLASADPAEGGIVFRLRRRGQSVEAAVIEMLVPSVPGGTRLTARMLRETGADYAIGIRGGRAAGLLPLPKQGPLLTTRTLATAPPAAEDWALSLADVELL